MIECLKQLKLPSNFPFLLCRHPLFEFEILIDQIIVFDDACKWIIFFLSEHSLQHGHLFQSLTTHQKLGSSNLADLFQGFGAYSTDLGHKHKNWHN